MNFYSVDFQNYCFILNQIFMKIFPPLINTKVRLNLISKYYDSLLILQKEVKLKIQSYIEKNYAKSFSKAVISFAIFYVN